jgi:hypothetical protein
MNSHLDLLEAVLEAAQDSKPFEAALMAALGPEARRDGFTVASQLESLRRQRAGQESAREVTARPVRIAAGEERYFRATVEVFIAAEDEGEACDLMSGLLTENGVYGPDGMLRDWMYLAGPWEVMNVPADVTGREEYFAAWSPVPGGESPEDPPAPPPIFRHRTTGVDALPAIAAGCR